MPCQILPATTYGRHSHSRRVSEKVSSKSRVKLLYRVQGIQELIQAVFCDIALAVTSFDELVDGLIQPDGRA